MLIGIFSTLDDALPHPVFLVSRKRGLEATDYNFSMLVRVLTGFLFSMILVWTILISIHEPYNNDTSYYLILGDVY